MAQSDDLNNAVTALATAMGAEHDAVVIELNALAEAQAAAKNPDPVLSDAVTNAISNITHITGVMAQDAAALTKSIPAATTVPQPDITEPPTEPTVTPPTIATPEVTDPTAVPPSEPPADATTESPSA